MKNDVKIKTASDLRSVLFETMVGVLDGRVSVSQANSVASLSAQAHSSIRQEWDMRCYASEHLSVQDGSIVSLLSNPASVAEGVLSEDNS